MKVKVHYDRSGHRDLIRVQIRIDPRSVQLIETPLGVKVEMAGFAAGGELGGPALPVAFVRVALPASAQMEDIAVREVEGVRLTEQPVAVTSVQPAQPGPRELSEEQLAALKKGGDGGRFSREKLVAKPLPGLEHVPPRPELYERAMREKSEPAELSGKQVVGLTPVATLRVQPVRFDDRGRLEVATEMEVLVPYTVRPDTSFHDAWLEAKRLGRKFQPKVAFSAQARRAISIAKEIVVNPEIIGRYDISLAQGECEYVVITDNHTYDPITMLRTGTVAGDMVGAFQKLVDWKKARGLTARVVTISSILRDVAGFRSGARDLQETLRNFLKYAHAQWGTTWVVLGGDVSVVPVRHVIGSAACHIGNVTDAKPADGKGSWQGTYYRIHWTGAPRLTNLVRFDTGKLIPQDTSGTAALGWYYTTDDTYATRSTAATQYVRVNGPATDINGQYMAVTFDDNTVATDLYYASLVGTQYGLPGKHDWDLLDNGLYGQYNFGGTLDGVSFQADVSVGRVPVSSASEAEAYVAKVIAYEKFSAPDGSSLSRDWPSKVVYAASSWGGRTWIGRAGATLGNNQFRVENGGANARVQLETAPTSRDYNLISVVSGTDLRTLPYSTGARGWYFAADATSLDPSQAPAVIGPYLPVPSRWIVVRGDAAEVSPQGFVLDYGALDASIRDTEILRQQIQDDFGFSDFVRLYEDEVDLSPAEVAAGPVAHLTGEGLEAALNAGPHFVCLSGHGNWWGCCWLDNAMAARLNNGFHTFIAYADSCLTNRFDHEDAMSEDLIKNPNGGAVAYVGNSRYSWIEVGDNFERGFWKSLKNVLHIGVAADVRCAMLNENTGYWWLCNPWVLYSANLLGDPEMPVWTYAPLRFPAEKIPRKVLRRKPFPWKIPLEVAGDPTDYKVTLRQGERIAHVPVNDKGEAWMDLSDWAPSEVEMTVSGRGVVPLVTTMKLED